MKGYYVIPSDSDPIEYTGRNAKRRALKMGIIIYRMGDEEVFIQAFDDDDPDGCFASGETIFIKHIILLIEGNNVYVKEKKNAKN